MRRDDLTRLRHMLDAARLAASFTSGRSRNDLDILWATATVDLPQLVAHLERLLPSEQS